MVRKDPSRYWDHTTLRCIAAADDARTILDCFCAMMDNDGDFAVDSKDPYTLAA